MTWFSACLLLVVFAIVPLRGKRVETSRNDSVCVRFGDLEPCGNRAVAPPGLSCHTGPIRCGLVFGPTPGLHVCCQGAPVHRAECLCSLGHYQRQTSMARKKRRPSPAFPVYPKDFLGDRNTITMTAEEVGVYWLLLLHSWEEGARLPNDHDELAALGRVDRATFDTLWKRRLSRCFTVSRNKRWLSNTRQSREAAKQRAYSVKQSANARAGVDKRRAVAEPLVSQERASAVPPTTPSPTTSSSNVRTSEDPSKVRCNRCKATGEDWGLLYPGTADQTPCHCRRGHARRAWYRQKKDREEQDAKNPRQKRGTGPTRVSPDA